jgi:phenylalanyl-tRNA synthetase beta chain
MLVSWDWLKEYVELDMSHDELADKLTMSGLNHEGTEYVGDDQSIDLEVTSNRPDCLGHIGVAREVAVLYDKALKIPATDIPQTGPPISDSVIVDLQCDDLCHRFTARLIRGVKIDDSPDWMVKRLQAVFPGYKSINNIADITNYVMMECGQPLHAFDFSKIDDGKIVVRKATDKEAFVAIDHKEYKLDDSVCVIADPTKAMAIGGVMGGADTEVNDATVDVLIEAAEFSQMSIRGTARKLTLHSPASHRFERPIDPEGTDFASKRCCQLILELAGGELASGVIDVGSSSYRSQEVTLRLEQLKRILGIEVPPEIVPTILSNLGCEVIESNEESVTVKPPTWRRDLTRECDLIEEVGRIYGFDKVPENADVPMAATVKRNEDRVAIKLRSLMTAAGFDEAVTASLIPEPWSEVFSPWTQNKPLVASQPMLGVLEKASQNIGRVEFLRRSIVPSLLEARRINEHRGGVEAELFEIAKVYLPTTKGALDEPVKITFVSSRDYFELKGVVDSLVYEVNPETQIDYDFCQESLLDKSRSAIVKLAGKTIGYIGELSKSGMKEYDLRRPCSVAEIDVQALIEVADLVPQHKQISDQPTITRDFNFVVDESLQWSELSRSVASSAGEFFESVEFVEIFRNTEKDGEGKKRVLLSVKLRSQTTTLTGEQAEKACSSIIEECKKSHGAEIVA